MSKWAKRVLSVLLACVMVGGVTPLLPPLTVQAASLTSAQFQAKLADLKKQYPTGTSVSKIYNSKGAYKADGSGDCWTCVAWARFMFYNVWGVAFNDAKKVEPYHTDISRLAIGDYLRYGNHSVFITDIKGDTIYYVDGNGNKDNKIKWERTKNRYDFTSIVSIRHYKDNNLTQSSTNTTTSSASSHVVTFNANNGTINTNRGLVSTGTRSVNNNAIVGTLPTPTCSGYAFNGWFTAQTGGTRINADTKITVNVTYWARWTAITTMTATTYYTTKSDVPIRANPFDTDPIIRYLAQNTVVTIGAKTTNSSGNIWYRTNSGTWIFSGNLSTKATTPATVTTTQKPISITSAIPNRTAGTTRDKYNYTITTNIPATRIEFTFSGNSKVYYIYSNGNNNINSGTVQFSNGGKTLQWNGDTLGAGNPRTITVAAYNGNQKSAPQSFRIVVK